MATPAFPIYDIVRDMAAAQQCKSEYLLSLSVEAKQRYESKITGTGLDVDPYVIDELTQAPENIPRMAWSDVCLYMVSTPSPYTKEAVKVRLLALY